MSLPKDSFLLLSYINTQLRDNFPTLDELCAAMGEDKEGIVKKLSEIGYAYNKELNAFR